MDFVIAGPEKTATGWIDAAIRAHVPDILPTVAKETFYLDRLFHLGPRWHAALYAGQSRLRGEVSPSYFARPIARERLLKINAEARVVIVLRNPYERMASHVLHLMRRGVGNYAASDLGLAPEYWEEARHSSLYRLHGGGWRTAFGAERVLFVRYEDIKRAPAALLARIAEHIGIDWRPDPAWARDFSHERVFEARASSSGLTRAAYFLSRRLQEAGATRFVAAVRRSGVRRLLERGGEDLNAARARALALISAREDFVRDIDFAEDVLDANLEAWRRRPGAAPSGDAPIQSGEDDQHVGI